MVADPSYSPEASIDESGIAPLSVSDKTSELATFWVT